MRFEEPSSMVRWDSPLISMLWTDEGIPGQQVWDAVTKGDVKPPNAGTQAVGFFLSLDPPFSSLSTSLAGAQSPVIRPTHPRTHHLRSRLLHTLRAVRRRRLLHLVVIYVNTSDTDAHCSARFTTAGSDAVRAPEAKEAVCNGAQEGDHAGDSGEGRG